jgi:hypothetical protein
MKKVYSCLEYDTKSQTSLTLTMKSVFFSIDVCIRHLFCSLIDGAMQKKAISKWLPIFTIKHVDDFIPFLFLWSMMDIFHIKIEYYYQLSDSISTH